ncbi:hypothetical protein LTR78_002586 [Recurvomyces mirabilis]|uniref:Uncharacterized protein n=1 Tax=Recurvomyces mirabilis TaxID=574656 RepID=A0AAE0WTA6_9PEZI|nr:hypothetical protein LTR78_002586 [Recurvomyces mirabilis]KAK5157515.1 hypothetical protein LTS14_004280 [Recurvomyces mirabilis]
MALAGVVEKRERATSRLQKESRNLRQQRHDLLVDESETGDIMNGLAVQSHAIATWWPDSLTKRYLAGLIDMHPAFLVTIVSHSAPVQHGVLGLFSLLLPGITARLIWTCSRFGLLTGLELVIGLLSERLWRSARDKNAQLRIDAALRRLENTAQWMCDILLLPLEYYIIAQQLGVAPYTPLLLPFSPVSIHNVYSMYTLVWTPTLYLPYSSLLSSPAAFLLSFGLLTRVLNPPLQLEPHDLASTSQIALGDFATSTSAYQAANGLLPYLRNRIFSFRMPIMAWLNYRPVAVAQSPAEPDQDIVQIATKHGTRLATSHRAGSLATQVPNFLATNLDTLLIRLLLLPLEGMMLRAVLTSYAKSNLPKTLIGKLVAKGLTTSIGSGLSHLPSPGSWSETIAYYTLRASKVGLAMTLQSAVEMSVFAGCYTITRWQGTRFYGWRARTRRDAGAKE